MMRVVYFAERDGLIKIGTTQDLRQRLVAIHATLLAAEPGSFTRERELHRRFAAHQVRSEWFLPVPELRAYIDALPPLPEPERADVVPLLSPKQVADTFSVSVATVYTWVKRGQLRAVRLPRGRTLRFHHEDIDAFTGAAS